MSPAALDDAAVTGTPGVVATSAASTDPPRGLRRPGGFITLSPGLIGMVLEVDGFKLGYVWGLDGGYHFAFGKRFMLQVGGFFEHAPHRGNHQVRVGGVTRIGGGTERVFGYGVVRLGAEVNVVNVDLCDECNDNENPFAEPFAPHRYVVGLPGVGAGVLGMVHRVVGLGGELGYDFSAFHFENRVRIRLVLALKF